MILCFLIILTDFEVCQHVRHLHTLTKSPAYDRDSVDDESAMRRKKRSQYPRPLDEGEGVGARERKRETERGREREGKGAREEKKERKAGGTEGQRDRGRELEGRKRIPSIGLFLDDIISKTDTVSASPGYFLQQHPAPVFLLWFTMCEVMA